MKKIITMLLIVSPFALCAERQPTDQEIEKTVVQTMELSKRATGDGMSYQILKRCGASTEILRDIKIYLYHDIKKTQFQNPQAKVNVDGLFEEGFGVGNDFYEKMKNNPKFCEGIIEQAKKYIAEGLSIM